MNEDELLKRKVLDTANQAFHHNIYTYTNFLSISELAVCLPHLKRNYLLYVMIYTAAILYANASLSALARLRTMAMMPVIP